MGLFVSREIFVFPKIRLRCPRLRILVAPIIGRRVVIQAEDANHPLRDCDHADERGTGVRRGPGGSTIRHRLASLASLFDYFCEKNAVTHNEPIVVGATA
jgi:hypothetical protein